MVSTDGRGWCGAGILEEVLRVNAPEQMVCSANNAGSLERGGCGCSGDRGGEVKGGMAEQMGWGRVDLALNADLF